MIEIAVNNLAAATGARTVTGEADRVCRGCVIDSRQVEEGTIFVAFPGENVDGNDFASRAVQSGAGAVVMTREPEAELVSLAQYKGCAILLTDDPEEFLLRLAHTYRLELGCLVVGITGSIGKTTTKDVLAAVLAKRYRVWATKGNFNNLIGMPLTVLSAPADTEVLVLEMGMNHFHEIERLSKSANPNLAIVSKIGTSHIGILGSRENIARAKAEIISGNGHQRTTRDGRKDAVGLRSDDFVVFRHEENVGAAGFLHFCPGGGVEIHIFVKAFRMSCHDSVKAHSVVESRFDMTRSVRSCAVKIADFNCDRFCASLKIRTYRRAEDSELIFLCGFYADHRIRREDIRSDI